MKLVKFFMGIITLFGLIKLFKYYRAEVELNEGEDYEIYDDELEHPLFV